MLRVVGRGPVGNTAAPDTLTLDHADRHIRRKVLTTDCGRDVLLEFDTAIRMADGDRLELDDGSSIAIVAAHEHLLEITARDASHHAELCWHLGNRHVAAELTPDRILIAHSAVIATMLRGLGATVTERQAPFHPITGAYHHAH